MSAEKLTIAIPLHCSAAWYENVCANLDRLKGCAQLVVSDATEFDDTLARLKDRYTERADIEWLCKRKIEPGWISHCNDLLASTRTPLFMWLPHDDEIGPDWPAKACKALEDRPEAAMACGYVVPREGEGFFQPGIMRASPEYTHPDVQRRLAEAGRRLYADGGSLGVLFRSVLRTDLIPPLPKTTQKEEWADLFWILGILKNYPIEIFESEYVKSWHKNNTHGKWRRYYNTHEFINLLCKVFETNSLNPYEYKAIVSFWEEFSKSLINHNIAGENRFSVARQKISELESTVNEINIKNNELTTILNKIQNSQDKNCPAMDN
jgi:hypothetical protein